MAEFYRSTLLKQYPDCIHAVTTKDLQLACSGSLALHTGESKEEVIGNRSEVAQALGVHGDFHFIAANQTHGDHIVVIKRAESKGWHALEDTVADCDALITDRKGVMLTVLTADCVPILILDTEKKVIAAVHAGWKGTQANIVGKTVQKMKEVYGSTPRKLAAFVAPAIGKCCYEVGFDVAQYFSDADIYDKVGEKYMLDLPLINKKQLMNEGLLELNIELSGVCTACEVDTYFSYRKEKGCSGRFMSMIGLIP